MYFIKLATLSSHSHHSHRLYTHGQCPRPSKHSGPARPKGTPHAKGVFHLVSREMPQRVGQLATYCFPKQHAVCTGVLVHATCEQDLRLTAVTRQMQHDGPLFHRNLSHWFSVTPSYHLPFAWETWGPERLVKLPKVTHAELGCDQVCLPPGLCSALIYLRKDRPRNWIFNWI